MGITDKEKKLICLEYFYRMFRRSPSGWAIFFSGFLEIDRGETEMKKALVFAMIIFIFSSCDKGDPDWKLEEVNIPLIHKNRPSGGLQTYWTEQQRTILFNSKTGEAFLLTAVYHYDDDTEDFRLVPAERMKRGGK